MRKNYLFIPVVVAFMSSILSGCSKGRVEDVRKHIVINELLASNRTGLLTEKGKTEDWIEFKNISNDTIDLEGFQLSIISAESDSIAEADPEKVFEQELAGSEDDAVWTFPSVKIAGGENLVLFVRKKKEKEGEGANKPKKADKPDRSGRSGKTLKADLKMSKKGGTIQLMSPSGVILTELDYPELAADQAYALQPDSTYAPTYLQSPGFENTPAGFEAAVEFFDDQRKDPLKIWEFMTREDSSDANWVELKNTGETAIDLSAYSLSKRGKKRESWQLPPRTLQPGQFIVIRLFGKNANPANGVHAPFKSGNAETIVLMKDGKFVDGVNARQTPIGISIGRMPGKKGFFYFSRPTKNEENDPDGRRFIADKPEFNFKAGLYPKQKELVLRLKSPHQKVHYTTDGSIPTANSPLFKDSVLIKRGTTLRYFAEGDNVSMRSPLVTSTYLLGVEHTVPVVNITVNNGDLYNYSKGIYAEGPGYTEEWPHQGANYWQNWTKNAHVELFDSIGGFTADCGLSIFGGFSRAEPKKSFRLKFRGKYGMPEAKYDFFGTGVPVEVENIVLRAGGQDHNRCMLRDEFFTSLMQPHSESLMTQMYQPVALYINGDYFGLYYLREKINRNFVARKLNLPSNDDFDMVVAIGGTEEGRGEDYRTLRSFIATHDMAKKENYDHVKKNLDVLGLIDYKLAVMFSGNSDVGNVRYVRSRIPESDGKWHFVFYDQDATWVSAETKVPYYLGVGPEQKGVAVHNIMINRLLANKEFRRLFLERLSYHLANTFSPKNTTAVFDALVSRIQPEMVKNCRRWPELSYAQWERYIADFRKKFDVKPKNMLKEIKSYLKVTPEEDKKYFSNIDL